ncbi:MAG: hypothetical protein U0869_23645 [Chloroflexota bacterium]
MTDQLTDEATTQAADVATPSEDAPRPRSRRSLLTAAAAALGAVAAQSVASVMPADAATGSIMKAGVINTAGSTTTVKTGKAGIPAVLGYAAADGTGVSGVADQGTNAVGVSGSSAAGIGVVGDGGGIGVSGTAHDPLGAGVYGVAKNQAAYGVQALSVNNHGIFGQSTAANKAGVYGQDQAANGVGVAGRGPNTSGFGVQGFGNTGVYGSSDSAAQAGVDGRNTAASQGVGVAGRGNTTNGYGVQGFGKIGVYASGIGQSGTGVQAEANASGGDAVYGVNSNGTGVRGISTVFGGNGVVGQGMVGVYGRTTNAANGGVGVLGNASSAGGRGVWGDDNGATGALAGYFYGSVQVTGTLSKAAGSFLIDHPLDPENRYLAHSFVESPEMLNVYSGTVTLGANGRATVRLPAWFEALNMEHRYQLTAIGAPAPELHVASEIADNRFVIAGGAAGLKVCWQVTGVRQDAYARKHRIKVDTPKKADERGKYLNPEAFGKRRTAGIGYRKPPKLARQRRKGPGTKPHDR